MNNRQRILWITRTAVFIALLVAAQTLSKALGQYVTGSLVNVILILSVMLGGLLTGATVAVLSPLFAFLAGIGPAMPPVIPVVMLGNLVLVLVWHVLAAGSSKQLVPGFAALVVGALAKFLVLYLGIVKLVVPVILKLPDPQAAVLSASFSYPQLITAAVGGALALAVLPLLRRALKQG